MKTRFILIETSHAGNVGAVARAMKVMGFHDLVLVRPRWANVLRRQETIQRASGALDVLHNARIVDTLDEALEGMDHLCATVMTARYFGPPTRAPRSHFAALLSPSEAPPALPKVPPKVLLNQELLVQVDTGLEPDLTPENSLFAAKNDIPTGVALLFGCERFGMSNADVYRCHVALQIPTNPDFGSLNLAAAVQLLAYDWQQALSQAQISTMPALDIAPEASSKAAHTSADAAAIAGVLAHWQQALEAIGFLDPQAPKKLMPRLNQLLNRSALQAEEVHILRGIAKAVLLLQKNERVAPAEPVDVPATLRDS